jgi:cyclophilin family peptidyl-prolyl cis-trans isomerase
MLFAVVACSGTESTTTSTDATTTTATESTASQPATTDPATTSAAPTATNEENAMSNYENKVAELHTTAGEIHIRFRPDVAPNHVKNFLDLANKGFYNGTKFHRVIPGFMIQGGDPNTISGSPATWGTGGAPSNVKAEFNNVSHKRGIVSMARSQSPDSASSQFFIVVADSTFLDRQYSVFGEVVKGMDVADKIVSAPKGAQDRPNDPVAITKVVVRDARDDEKGTAAN